MKSVKKALFFMGVVFIILSGIIYFLYFHSTVSNESIVAKSVYYNAERPVLEPNGKGDVNNDGKIDESDEQMILEHVNAGKTLTSEEKGRADINGDGQVTAQDAQDLQMFIRENQGGQGGGGQGNPDQPTPPGPPEGPNTNPTNNNETPQNPTNNNTTPQNPTNINVENTNNSTNSNKNNTNSIASTTNGNKNTTNNNGQNANNTTNAPKVIPKAGLDKTIIFILIVLAISTGFVYYKYHNINIK